MTEENEKVRENRLRRMADRQGLRLMKSRSRDPNAIDFGLYALIMHDSGGAVNPSLADRWVCSWTIDEVEAYLKGEPMKSRAKLEGDGALLHDGVKVEVHYEIEGDKGSLTGVDSGVVDMALSSSAALVLQDGRVVAIIMTESRGDGTADFILAETRR